MPFFIARTERDKLRWINTQPNRTIAVYKTNESKRGELYSVSYDLYDWFHHNWICLNPIPEIQVGSWGAINAVRRYPGERKEKIIIENLPEDVKILLRVNENDFVKTVEQLHAAYKINLGVNNAKWG